MAAGVAERIADLASAYPGSRGSARTARGLLLALPGRRRRPHLLWARFPRPIPARGRLRRSRPQGREAGRPAGPTADQIRARRQSQDRQEAGPRHPRLAARPRRRGHRMRRRDFAVFFWRHSPMAGRRGRGEGVKGPHRRARVSFAQSPMTVAEMPQPAWSATYCGSLPVFFASSAARFANYVTPLAS